MADETDERARQQAEQIQRQMRMIEQRRPETEKLTRSALRRTLLAVTVILLGFALWRWLS
jgi:hypothetical protein